MNDWFVASDVALVDVRRAIQKNETVMVDRVAFIHRHPHGAKCNDRCERVPSLTERLAAEARVLAAGGEIL